MPERILTQLAVQPAELAVQVSGTGYLAATARATVPAQPGFPAVFVPPPIGVVELHRTPLSVHGRTVRRTAAGVMPLAGVAISVAEIWLLPPPPGGPVAGLAPDLLHIQPALSRALPAPGGSRRIVGRKVPSPCG